MNKNIDLEELQYQYASNRIEELIHITDSQDDDYSKENIELSIMSDVVWNYEQKHVQMPSLTPAQMLEVTMEELGLSQKEVAKRVGISPSRISDYVNGRAEPTLKVAARLCKELHIPPAIMLGI